MKSDFTEISLKAQIGSLLIFLVKIRKCASLCSVPIQYSYNCTISFASLTAF